MTITPASIVEFWRGAGPKAWFAKCDTFDDSVRARFECVHHAAARGEHDEWLVTAEGALATLLLLDQFPRNMWRRSAHAYATDPLARRVATGAINCRKDEGVEIGLRAFFYMPFTHSEDSLDQDVAMKLFGALQRAGGPDAHSASIHHDIIARFGRFPHRNGCLGRKTTPEEAAFLEAGGFSG